MKLYSVFILITMIVICSCSKEKGSDINGKWTEVAVFDGSWTNRNKVWQPVSDINADHLYFSENGQFNQKRATGSLAYELCTGSYQLTGTNLVIQSSCNSMPLEYTIDLLDSHTLVCEVTGLCGPMKYKYVRESGSPDIN